MLAAILGVLIVVALALGLLAGFALQSKREKTKLESADADAARILNEAQTKEKELLLEAKAESLSVLSAAEAEAKERRAGVLRLEQRILRKEENLERKTESGYRRVRTHESREAERDESGDTQTE